MEDPACYRLSDLVIYPIKSLPGIRVSRAIVTTSGLVGYPRSLCLRDREFMVVDEHGTFLTMRTHADAFTKISISLEDNGHGKSASLVLRAPEITKETLTIPLQDQEKSTLMDVRVWNWRGQARVVEYGASRWISNILGVSCHIVRCDGHDHHRPVDGTWVTERTRSTACARFADGFPYLFVFEESFKDLALDLKDVDFTMERFRGNVCISGGTAWQEDALCSLTINSVEFDLVKPCSRCKVPTIDPRTASVDPVVHDVLARKRSGKVLGWEEPKSFKHATFFGVNGLYHLPTDGRVSSMDINMVTSKDCTISLGDHVHVGSI